MPFAFLSGWFTVCRSAWCLCTGSQTRRAWFTEEAHLQRYSMIRIENIETMTPQQSAISGRCFPAISHATMGPLPAVISMLETRCIAKPRTRRRARSRSDFPMAAGNW